MLAEVAIWTNAASTTGHRVDLLFFVLAGICGGVGLLVAVLLIYFCVRYRRKSGDVGNPPEVYQSKLLEWFWTLTPLGIFAVFFAWGGQVYYDAYSAPENATPIYVVAKQWMWKFQHPEGQREIDTLHVPVGKPIKLLLISEDVIHSFFVPAFRIHMDVLPERYTSVWFKATTPGEYHLFCSQYCGTNHAGMVGRVIVMGAAEYQRWLNSSAEGSLALRGRQVFLQYRCVSCHSADSNARAPVLENLFGKAVPLTNGSIVRADDAYIRNSILHPSAQIVEGWRDIMPPFEGQISEEQVLALIGFIKSLKVGDTPRRVETYPPPAKTQPVPHERNLR
ncbi:MAG TPA: cytochrome c oxidase subunit II [Lacipirellulaceae bacterium]|nr:cytochrome c oxidase subunit II [Lacipirellulaceae bacterium]